MTFTTFDKALTAALGMALIVLNALAGVSVGLTPDQQGWVTLALAVLTPVGVYFKRNASK